MAEETKNESIVAHYIGAGSWVIGIPTRDLTQADYQALSPELQQTVGECGLYRLTVAAAGTRPGARAGDKE